MRASSEEIARRQQAEETKQRQIKELMDEAQRLYRERRYDDAVETLKQVQAIAPDYELARWLQDRLGGDGHPQAGKDHAPGHAARTPDLPDRGR